MFNIDPGKIENVKNLDNNIEPIVLKLCQILISIFEIMEEIGTKYGSNITEEESATFQECPVKKTTSSEVGTFFENSIKIKLEEIGFAISMTPITGDQGVDIIATRNGQKYAIQCKSYSGQVGNAAVQEVIAGKIFYDCDYACVITNSNFTPSAYQLAAKAEVIMCANENLESLK
jgi:HJR/Mrr/RecB family endonuclease